jgi:PIN domain nuclease of toxin-antitoxin system
MTHYVLDACALIAIFKKEEGFEIVRDLITAADTSDHHEIKRLEQAELLDIYWFR